jgi:hypothetical protein
MAIHPGGWFWNFTFNKYFLWNFLLLGMAFRGLCWPTFSFVFLCYRSLVKAVQVPSQVQM